MTPLLVSGIASIASSAIDAWSNAANRRVAVEQAKFEGAMNRAMGVPAGSTLSPAPTSAQGLENQLRNAPEIRAVLDAQQPSQQTSLQVGADGRVWLNVAGNPPTELTISAETQALARQLNVARAAGSVPVMTGTQPAAGSLVTLTR